MAKQKKCKQCGGLFTPFYSTIQATCSIECAVKFNTKKEVDKRVRQMKAELRTHSDYVQILQKVFNEYIRLRDKDKPCISCGKPLEGVYHSGHFHSVGRCPELRFNEDNAHGQCVQCNTHLSGNLANYSNNLPKRIGWERYEELFAPRNPEKLTIQEIKEKIIHYKNKIKDYEKNKSNINI